MKMHVNDVVDLGGYDKNRFPVIAGLPIGLR